MDRQTINRVSGMAPVVMSLLALVLVAVSVTTGWERDLKDEGTAAHLFQLLILAQAPLILLFLGTANWSRVRQVAVLMAAQAIALVLAFGSVAYFHL